MFKALQFAHHPHQYYNESFGIEDGTRLLVRLESLEYEDESGSKFNLVATPLAASSFSCKTDKVKIFYDTDSMTGTLTA
ncbi:MAG: hypothetical protein Q4E47_02785 [Candidatus Saccharibacteria bacterium]|nr:hypothetical protein [Candidatus Saccharibacteria bacterium]